MKVIVLLLYLVFLGINLKGQISQDILYQKEDSNKLVIVRMYLTEDSLLEYFFYDKVNRVEQSMAYDKWGKLIRMSGQKNGQRNGRYYWLDKSKEFYVIQNVLDGKETGSYHEYWLDHKPKKEAYFLDGKLHGSMKTWNKAGFLETVTEYSMGKLDGCEIEYGPNGDILSKYHFKNDKQFGPFFSVSDGERTEGVFINDKKNGIISIYDQKTNSLLSKGLYFDGKKQGVFEYYDLLGNLIRTEEYIDGVRLQTKEKRDVLIEDLD